MMVDVKKHGFLWGVSAVLAFAVGLLVNFPAAVVYDKLKPELPTQITQALGNIDGSIWNGRAMLREGALKSEIDWALKPVDLIFGDPGLILRLYEADHDLEVTFNPSGQGNGRIELTGVVHSGLINRQLGPYGIRVNNDIQLNAIEVVLHDDHFSEGNGTVTWEGGTVSYNSPSPKTIQMPALRGLLSTDDGVLTLDITETGKSVPISTITFKADGWFGAEVKPTMAELILLPKRRVNRAGNVLEVKRKIF